MKGSSYVFNKVGIKAKVKAILSNITENRGVDVATHKAMELIANIRTNISNFLMAFIPFFSDIENIMTLKIVTTPFIHAPGPAPSESCAKKIIAVISNQRNQLNGWGITFPLLVSRIYKESIAMVKMILATPKSSFNLPS